MRIFPILFPLLAILAGPAAVALGGAPQADRPVVVVVAPWADAPAVVARAGGRVIGPERAPMAVLALAGGDDFVARLRGAGALWVFDGAALANLCGVG